MKLIDKDALIAEIDKRMQELHPTNTHKMQVGEKVDRDILMWLNALTFVKDLLDTLEVKDVDLEKESEKELAELYINIFDEKFGNKLPKLKCTQLAEFKNFINTCEQIFRIKYFDYHATQGKLFEKFALLWAVWGKEHLLSTEIKEVDLDLETALWAKEIPEIRIDDIERLAKYFFELGLKAQKGE